MEGISNYKSIWNFFKYKYKTKSEYTHTHKRLTDL